MARVKFDMWYGDEVAAADKIDCFFSDCDCVYRGNLYRDGKAIGDYSAKDSVALENTLRRIFGGLTA